MTPWTIACQAPLSMEFSRQEFWPFPCPGDLPNPGFKPRSPALQVHSLPSEPPLAICCILYISMCVWCYYCLPPVTAEEKLWNSVNIEQEPQKEIETVLKLENVSVNENLLNVLREKWQISHGQRQIQTEDSGIFTASNQTRNKQLQKQWGNITAPT